MAGRPWRTVAHAIAGVRKRFSDGGRIRSVPHGVARRRGRPWSGTTEASSPGERSQRGWIRQPRSRAVGVAALLLVSSFAGFPTRAAAAASSTSVCIGTMNLTFTSPVTKLVSAPSFTLNGNGNCAGLGPMAITWTSSGMISLDATCEDIVATGQGSVSWGNTTVTMALAGPMAAPTWTAVDPNSLALVASGAFVWLDAGNPDTTTTQITNCLSGGTTAVTLTGAFVIVE